MRGFSGAKFECSRSLRFQAGNSSAELQHGLHLAHLLALVDQILLPVVRGLDLASHVCKLETDDRVIDEALAKSLTFVSVLHRLLVADAREAKTLDDDTNTLVVEVGHDDLETLVLLADEVLNGDFNVFEGDIGGSRTPNTLTIHSACRDAAHTALDKQQRDAIHAGASSADGSGKVLAPNSVGDPLLLAVDNVMFAIFRKLGFTCQIRDVATGICHMSEMS